MSRFIIVFALCGFVSLAMAQSEQTKTTPVKQAVAPVESSHVKAKAAQKSVEKVLAGVIVKINQEKKTISVKVKSGDYSISIDEKTVLRSRENQISFADLKKGDQVHIDYEKLSTGERMAVKVIDATAKTIAPAKAKTEVKQEAPATKPEPVAAPKATTLPDSAKPAVKPNAPVAPNVEAPKPAPVKKD